MLALADDAYLVVVQYCSTLVDAPSVAGGEPFAGGFRLVDAGLEEDSYLAALREGEVAGSVAFQRRADTFRKLLLRLYNYIAETLNGCLIVGLCRALLLFYVAHGNDNSYKFHNFEF